MVEIEAQEEAAQMSLKYGKSDALKRCDFLINEYIDEINTQPVYDGQNITRLQHEVCFWACVKSFI